MSTVINKYLATAIITDPSLVSAQAASRGDVADPGAIYCSIPEAGFMPPNLIYCRYGLSIPYMRIQPNWKVWVEPSVNTDERWIFTGIADCAGETVTSADQLLIKLLTQVIYASTAGTLHLSNKTAAEPFVLGTSLNTENQKLKSLLTNLLSVINGAPITEPGSGSPSALQAALKTALTTNVVPSYGVGQLSTKIFGE
jgi:hypothetical protein